MPSLQDKFVSVPDDVSEVKPWRSLRTLARARCPTRRAVGRCDLHARATRMCAREEWFSSSRSETPSPPRALARRGAARLGRSQALYSLSDARGLLRGRGPLLPMRRRSIRLLVNNSSLPLLILAAGAALGERWWHSPKTAMAKFVYQNGKKEYLLPSITSLRGILRWALTAVVA